MFNIFSSYKYVRFALEGVFVINRHFKKMLSCILGVGVLFFNSNVSFAGNDKPLDEHPELVTKYLEQEIKYSKINDLSSTNVSYTRKEDFFLYDELRTITLHNMHSAFDLNEGIIPNYLKAIQNTMDTLRKYAEAIYSGNYELKGKNEDERLRNFLADISEEISIKPSITSLGRGLYGYGNFKSHHAIDVANAVVASMFTVSMELERSYWGVAWDIFDIISLVVMFVPYGCASGGATRCATNATKSFWAKNGTTFVSKKTAEKLGYNNIRTFGGKLVNGAYKIAPEVLEALGSWLKSIGVKCPSLAMKKGAVLATSIAGRQILTGVKDNIIWGLAKNSKNSLNSDGNFDLSVQLTKQRVDCTEQALRDLYSQIIDETDKVLDSNVLVCAIDRRNLNTWIPGLALANRFSEPQKSFLHFHKIPNAMSPTVRNSKERYRETIMQLKEALTTSKSFSENMKNNINNIKELPHD